MHDSGGRPKIVKARGQAKADRPNWRGNPVFLIPCSTTTEQCSVNLPKTPYSYYLMSIQIDKLSIVRNLEQKPFFTHMIFLIQCNKKVIGNSNNLVIISLEVLKRVN